MNGVNGSVPKKHRLTRNEIIMRRREIRNYPLLGPVVNRLAISDPKIITTTHCTQQPSRHPHLFMIMIFSWESKAWFTILS